MLGIMELVEDKNNNNFNIKKYSDRTIYFSNSNYIEPIVFHQDNISTFSVLKPESITIKAVSYTHLTLPTIRMV